MSESSGEVLSPHAPRRRTTHTQHGGLLMALLEVSNPTVPEINVSESLQRRRNWLMIHPPAEPRKVVRNRIHLGGR